MDRRSGKDYRKEYNKHKRELTCLEVHVLDRLEGLLMIYPDFVLTGSTINSIRFNIKKILNESTVDERISLIEKIEKWVNKKYNNKQLEINFPT